MAQRDNGWIPRSSASLEELLRQVSRRERELKDAIRGLRRKGRVNAARRVAFGAGICFFVIFLSTLASVYLRAETPAWIRYGGAAAYLLATLSFVAVCVADGALGFAAMLAPMTYLYPLHLKSMKSDYAMTLETAVLRFRSELPEAARLLNAEADELEQRCTLLSGILEKAGIGPLLLAGNVAAGTLTISREVAADGLATSNLWPSFSAAAFVLVVANISMKLYSMTLRRYASVFDRARLMLDEAQHPPTTMAVADMSVPEPELMVHADALLPEADAPPNQLQRHSANEGPRPQFRSGQDAPRQDQLVE